MGTVSVPEYQWRTALLESDVSHAMLRIGLMIATYGTYQTGRDVKPSMVTVATRLGYSREYVMRIVRNLKAAGWLTPSGSKGQKGVIDYILTLPPGEQQDGSSHPPVNPRSSHNLIHNPTMDPHRGPMRKATKQVANGKDKAATYGGWLKDGQWAGKPIVFHGDTPF